MAFYGEYEVAGLERIAKMAPPADEVDFDSFPYTPALAWFLSARCANSGSALNNALNKEAEALLAEVAERLGVAQTAVLGALRPWTQRLVRSSTGPRNEWWRRARTQSGHWIDKKGNVRSKSDVSREIDAILPPIGDLRRVLDARSKRTPSAPSAFLPLMQRILDDRLRDRSSPLTDLTSTEAAAMTSLSAQLDTSLGVEAGDHLADRRRNARGRVLQAFAWVLTSMAKPTAEADLEADDPEWLHAIATIYEHHAMTALAPRVSTPNRTNDRRDGKGNEPRDSPLTLTRWGFVQTDRAGQAHLVYVPDPEKGGTLNQRFAGQQTL